MGMYTIVSSAMEVAHTAKEDFDVVSGSASASVTLIVPAADRYAVVDDILSNEYYWPHGFNPATAAKCSIVPVPNSGVIDASNNGFVYADYHINVSYSTKKNEQGKTQDGSGNIYSEELVPLTEFLTIDYKDFEWDANNPLKEGEAPTKIFKSFNYSRTLYNLQPPLPMALLDMPGCCNAAPFLSPTLGLFFNAETLLFGDPNISRTLTMQGYSGITLRTTFGFKKQGWNKFWRPETGDYYEIKKKSDGSVYKNHPLADFSFLLF